MSDARPAQSNLCGAPCPKAEGLTCLKPAGHAMAHAACLGYHPEWEDANGLLHEGEYEWVEWWRSGYVRPVDLPKDWVTTEHRKLKGAAVTLDELPEWIQQQAYRETHP